MPISSADPAPSGEPRPACPACGRRAWTSAFEAADMYTGRRYPVERCASCGLGRTVASVADEAELYRVGTSADAGSRFGPLEPVMRALRRLRTRRLAGGRPGRALDVGCARGVFLEALAARGWDVHGTELSAEIGATARARLGDRVHIGPLGALALPRASFDLVTFWHVLEHVDDPAGDLARARELLAPRGRILVGVPNWGSWQARAFGRDWLHLDVPRHRWHFTLSSLERLAARTGLVVEGIEHFSLEYGPFGVLQGVATKLGLGHRLFTELVRARPGRLWRSPAFWRHVALSPALAAAAALAIPAEGLAALAGGGGAVLVTLRAGGAAAVR